MFDVMLEKFFRIKVEVVDYGVMFSDDLFLFFEFFLMNVVLMNEFMCIGEGLKFF